MVFTHDLEKNLFNTVTYTEVGAWELIIANEILGDGCIGRKFFS